MTSSDTKDLTVWRWTPFAWGALLLLLAGLSAAFYDSLREMVHVWGTQEAYSHGYLIPFIALFLLWQRKDRLERIPFEGSWLGIAVVLIGFLVYFAGSLSTIYVLVQYAFVIVLLGIALGMMGKRGTREVAVPLFMLVFMIPLPVFLYRSLSANLQLLSSEIGVAVIRMFGISVHLEGNVIDLGSYKLQVVEACSGLNYLFPLMSLAFIAAYLYKAAFWKRAVVFLSSIPITVFMNSFRIGVIGVLVEYWGPAQAEGFLHDFEGWVIFMGCTAILVIEVWLLERFSKGKRPLHEIFGLEFPAPTPAEAQIRYRAISKPLIGILAIVLASAATGISLERRDEIRPARSDFTNFPMEISEWKGQRETMEKMYLDLLKLDDYFLANYVSTSRDKAPVNFYIAYYATQRTGEAAHSPRSCIPGGGWKIMSIEPHVVGGVTVGNASLTVNRLVIQKGEYKQLVYYWFQQRGRVITNEYMVKWYLFWDALTRNRTDGALVRLTTMIPPGGDLVAADKQFAEFSGEVMGRLKEYIPD